MGVYIKGMEMPKNCFECPWRCKVDPDNLLCRISGEYFEETFSGTIQNRHKSCPLVPVPPHGDLVDRAEMREIAISLLVKTVTDQEANAIREMWSHLGQMPVIIPAEDGE